jgi:hypothetical protein
MLTPTFTPPVTTFEALAFIHSVTFSEIYYVVEQDGHGCLL